jgi:hypothetical protein
MTMLNADPTAWFVHRVIENPSFRAMQPPASLALLENDPDSISRTLPAARTRGKRVLASSAVLRLESSGYPSNLSILTMLDAMICLHYYCAAAPLERVNRRFDAPGLFRRRSCPRSQLCR